MNPPDLNGTDPSPAVTMASVEGSRLEVAAKNRDKICLLSDGTLLIAESYLSDIDVLSYVELLRRIQIEFKIKPVAIETIRERYASLPFMDSGNDNTRQQNQFVRLVTKAVKRRASDIHFCNYAKQTEIWMRIDGFLEKVHELTSEDGNALCSTMYGSMCDVADETYKPGQSQDGRLGRDYLESCGLYGARIATRPMEYGNLVVLRLLYGHNSQRPSLHDLGYLQEQIALITRMTRRTTGINIFSGATGSGKSTSLEALLSQLIAEFQQQIHVLTIEDPPEYVIHGAVQTPIICNKNDPKALSHAWAHAITNAMRLDPDVIMIGEMRDHDSAVAAFRAAMTGHGVWTTLHTNSAMQILDRLRDMQVDIGLITDAALVTGLINQSLVPLNCPDCKRPLHDHGHTVKPDLQERIQKFCTPESVFLRGASPDCPTCHGKGYLNRRVVAECIVPTQKLMDIYRHEGTAAARSLWVKEMHGITKCAHMIRLMNTGLLDPALGEQKVCSLDEDTLTLS